MNKMAYVTPCVILTSKTSARTNKRRAVFCPSFVSDTCRHPVVMRKRQIITYPVRRCMSQFRHYIGVGCIHDIIPLKEHFQNNSRTSCGHKAASKPIYTRRFLSDKYGLTQFGKLTVGSCGYSCQTHSCFCVG